MFKRIVILIVIFLNAFTLFARINETLDECRKRYGDCVHVENGIFFFIKGGFMIGIQFYDSKADLISFKKIEKDTLGISKELTTNEKKILLDNNLGENWSKMSIVSIDEYYQSNDGGIYASYSTFEHLLTIVTADHVTRQKTSDEEKEKQQMEGM